MYGELLFGFQVTLVVFGVYLFHLVVELAERLDPALVVTQQLRGLAQFVVGLAA